MRLTNGIDLNYEVISGNEIILELICKTQSWCAIGFGDSMINADIVRVSYDGY